VSDELQPLLDQVAAAVRRNASAIPPDFAGALARARELAPESIAACVDVDDTAVIDIRGGDRGSAASESAVAAIVDDTRAAVLRMVAAQRMRSIPPPPVPAGRRPRSRWIVGGLLAAASIVFAIGGYRFVELARERESGASADQAFHLEATSPAENSVIETVPDSDPPASKPKPVLPLGPAPLEPVVQATPQESAKSIVRRAAGLDDAALRRAAEEAHALWRAGDLKAAEQRFESIVAKGRRGVLIELAWADLFSIARQRGDDDRRVARWRSYLRAFPRGRFADDARAGLCRTGGGAKCWRAYLDDLPRGSYRHEAEAAIAGDGGP
jgi:hypothetical protein